jgi:hypothetical protein
LVDDVNFLWMQFSIQIDWNCPIPRRSARSGETQQNSIADNQGSKPDRLAAQSDRRPEEIGRMSRVLLVMNRGELRIDRNSGQISSIRSLEGKR